MLVQANDLRQNELSKTYMTCRQSLEAVRIEGKSTGLVTLIDMIKAILKRINTVIGLL